MQVQLEFQCMSLHNSFSLNALLLLSIIHPSLSKITEEEKYIHKGYEPMPLFIHESLYVNVSWEKKYTRN